MTSVLCGRRYEAWVAGVDGCWPRFSERLYPKGMKYQQLRSSRSSSGVYVCVGLEKRSHRCLMHTCDLRETVVQDIKESRTNRPGIPELASQLGDRARDRKRRRCPPKPVMGYQGKLEPCLVGLSVTAERGQEEPASILL